MKRVPLSRYDILNKVELRQSVPDSIPDENAKYLADLLNNCTAASEMIGAIAVWPDGTWALLGYDPDLARPRPYQLLRAYRTAFGIKDLAVSSVDSQVSPPRHRLIVNVTVDQ